MAPFDREFITGSAAVVILSLLREREMYGYEMVREAARRSAKVFALKEGTVYPALHEMERGGFVTARWRESEAGRARKYYSLTAAGRRRADSKRRQWASLAAAMQAILGLTHG
jgi:PadR family transcriptional regulator PadR